MTGIRLIVKGDGQNLEVGSVRKRKPVGRSKVKSYISLVDLFRALNHKVKLNPAAISLRKWRSLSRSSDSNGFDKSRSPRKKWKPPAKEQNQLLGLDLCAPTWMLKGNSKIKDPYGLGMSNISKDFNISTVSRLKKEGSELNDSYKNNRMSQGIESSLPAWLEDKPLLKNNQTSMPERTLGVEPSQGIKKRGKDEMSEKSNETKDDKNLLNIAKSLGLTNFPSIERKSTEKSVASPSNFLRLPLLNDQNFTDMEVRGSWASSFNLLPIVDKYVSKKCMNVDRKLIICGIFAFVCWILGSCFFYCFYMGFRWWQAFYYTVQAGFSVGFGIVPNKPEVSRAVTIVIVLCGSSLIVFCIALMLQSSMNNMNLYRRAVEDTFAVADKDMTGELTFSEFHAFLMAEKGEDFDFSRKEAKRLFDRIDTRKTGAITLDEWSAYLDENRDSGIGSWIWDRLDQWSMTISFIVWTCIGASYGMIYERWTIISSFYYSVTACSTAGLLAPSFNSTGMLFTGVFCAIGVPLYGLALGEFAEFFTDRMFRNRSKEVLQKATLTVALEYSEFLELLPDARLDWSHFLQLELIRLGRVDKTLLDMLRSRFDMLDRNRDGVIDSRDIVVTNNIRDSNTMFTEIARMSSKNWSVREDSSTMFAEITRMSSRNWSVPESPCTNERKSVEDWKKERP